MPHLKIVHVENVETAAGLKAHHAQQRPGPEPKHALYDVLAHLMPVGLPASDRPADPRIPR